MIRLIILLPILFLSACTNIEPPVVKSPVKPPGIAETYYSSQQCRLGKTIRWITSQDELDELIKGQNLQTISDKGPVLLERIDFSEHSILLISLGEQLSAGYGIGLLSPKITKEGDTGVISLLMGTPDIKVMNPPATSPCLILKLPVQEYSSFRLVDQHGVVFGEIAGP